jgi:hypothetical protein
MLKQKDKARVWFNAVETASKTRDGGSAERVVMGLPKCADGPAAVCPAFNATW